jgi:hypothetical protein
MLATEGYRTRLVKALAAVDLRLHPLRPGGAAEMTAGLKCSTHLPQQGVGRSRQGALSMPSLLSSGKWQSWSLLTRTGPPLRQLELINGS